ncbi:MAG: DEAD/DEAH box helicase family protein [Bacteroidetes bacterium]|nr:DEAD/DEAH box helicase family protein [Bacteroidota bacterium]
MQLTRDNLKDFQLKASGALAQMLQTYPAPPYSQRWNPDTGELLPFLCRLKAITGSGKTPMLALTASTLGDAIVLWTTNRGAVISQTRTKLSAGGDYAPLLPEDAEIRILSTLTDADWADTIIARTGLTVLLGTVALFNRDDNSKEGLNIHKDRNGTSYWEMLAGKGPDVRQRDLYIVYDEAHGTTNAQFARLTELNPRAFILASASPLNDDLSLLLPGKTADEKMAALELQTVKVDTKEVVQEGLLKTRLYLVDCNTTRSYAVREANDKWLQLRKKLSKVAPKETPIWCGVVNSTLAGLEVWEVLTQELGVDPTRIAVHLSGVEKAVRDGANQNVNWDVLVDTLKAGKTPEQLRDKGYTHIIWNLSLREGWDEPWAYVAYLDGSGKSLTDISQKIGRFLRQPNAAPFADGDLNSAYFYFNVPDEDFARLVNETQSEMEQDGHEVIIVSSAAARPKTSREVPVKKEVTIPMVNESFGEDVDRLDKILINAVPAFADEALKAPGKIKTRVLDMRRNREDGRLQKEESRPENADVRIWRYLQDRLAAIDGRIAQKNNWRFSPWVKENPKLKKKMQFGSEAMTQISDRLTTIQEKLNNEFRLEYEADEEYTVPPFTLVSPDYMADDLTRRERYRVRKYKHALHKEYNGLNGFEVAVADALDTLGLDWCRNPSRTGYGIPIPEIGAGTSTFYPDFLLWTRKCIWAIDPKGAHLLKDAVRTKLLGVSDVEDMPQRIRVAFIVAGEYEISQDRPQKVSSTGFTVILKENVGMRARHYDGLDKLVASLK